MSPSDSIRRQRCFRLPEETGSGIEIRSSRLERGQRERPPSPSAKLVDPCHPAAWAALTNELPALAPSSEAVAIAFTARTSSPITGSSLPIAGRGMSHRGEQLGRPRRQPTRRRPRVVDPALDQEGGTALQGVAGRPKLTGCRRGNPGGVEERHEIRVPSRASDQLDRTTAPPGARRRLLADPCPASVPRICGGPAPRRHHGLEP